MFFRSILGMPTLWTTVPLQASLLLIQFYSYCSLSTFLQTPLKVSYSLIVLYGLLLNLVFCVTSISNFKQSVVYCMMLKELEVQPSKYISFHIMYIYTYVFLFMPTLLCMVAFKWWVVYLYSNAHVHADPCRKYQ